MVALCWTWEISLIVVLDYKVGHQDDTGENHIPLFIKIMIFISLLTAYFIRMEFHWKIEFHSKLKNLKGLMTS